MVAYANNFAERTAQLTADLGGDNLAVRAANAIVKQMNIETLDALKAYRDEIGTVDFRYEITDLRVVGEKTIERILAMTSTQA